MKKEGENQGISWIKFGARGGQVRRGKIIAGDYEKKKKEGGRWKTAMIAEAENGTQWRGEHEGRRQWLVET